MGAQTTIHMQFNRIMEDVMALAWLVDLAVVIWAMWEVQFTVYHIALNLAVALAAAIRTGTFELAKIAEFLYRKLLPYLIVFTVATAVSGALSIGWLVTVMWALIELALLGDMVDNLRKMGVPIPDEIAKLFKRNEE
jgi:hypothetical protein